MSVFVAATVKNVRNVVWTLFWAWQRTKDVDGVTNCSFCKKAFYVKIVLHYWKEYKDAYLSWGLESSSTPRVPIGVDVAISDSCLHNLGRMKTCSWDFLPSARIMSSFTEASPSTVSKPTYVLDVFWDSSRLIVSSGVAFAFCTRNFVVT